MKNAMVKVIGFIKRRAVYLVLALCILAVGLSVTFMLINNHNDLTLDSNTDTPVIVEPDQTPVEKPDDTVDTKPVEKVVSFIMPVENPTSVVEYSETMVFNSTLNRFSSHMAMDFFSPEGSDVYAVYDGKVVDIETTFLQGTTITIDHGNGLYTIYNSLADGDSVSVGQKVDQGDVIGQVSLSNRQEYKAGAHLHFEVKENGQLIDPYKYLETQDK
ncbi:MAG: M23 family metallopeptidase [Clostridiales bacterium]|nr:M23 family metallopeptidase [Clostridiales bacterium]